MLARIRPLAAFLLAALSAPLLAQDVEETLTPEQHVERVLARMKEHNYFSKVLVQVDRSQPPLVFFLHKPQVEQPGWDTRVIGNYAPWLKKVEELFRTQFAEPLKLKRRGDMPLYPVCELQTEGDYLNYRKSQQEISINAGEATFDRRLRALVAYQELGRLKPQEKRYYLLTEFTRELLSAHYFGTTDKPPQAWFLEGFGTYLASHTGDDVKALDTRYISPWRLEMLVNASQDPQQREVYLLPIAELGVTRGIEQVWLAMDKRRAKAGAAKLDDTLQWRTYQAQSSLWVHYLRDGDEAKHRAGFGRFLTAVLGGNAGTDALKTALGVASLEELDRDFYRWLYARFEAANPGRKLERRFIDELFVARGPVVAGAAPAASPSALLPGRDDVAAAHGAILQRAKRGALDAAHTELTALEIRARTGPFGRRIAADLDRVARFIKLRDAHLANLIASGGKLEFEWDGKKVSAKPTRVEAGLVYLSENRAKLASVPLDLLGAHELAREMSKPVTDSPDAWVRAWAYVLAGDSRWKAMLKGDAPEIEHLRADALEWYPPLLAIGDAAARLTRISHAS